MTRMLTSYKDDEDVLAVSNVDRRDKYGEKNEEITSISSCIRKCQPLSQSVQRNE